MDRNPAEEVTFTYFSHGEPRSSAATRRTRWRCAARSASGTSNEEELRIVRRKGQAIFGADHRSGRASHRLRPRLPQHRARVQPGQGPRAARPVRLRGPRRRRLSRECRTAAPLILQNVQLAAHAGVQGDRGDLEEEHGRDRHQASSARKQSVSGAVEAVEGRTADECGGSHGRRQLARCRDVLRHILYGRRHRADRITRASTCPSTTQLFEKSRKSCPTARSGMPST